MKTIDILVSDSNVLENPHQEPILGPGRRQAKPENGSTVSVNVEKLRDSLKELASQLNEVFGEIKAVGDFSLKEVALTAEVSAEGKLILVGKAGISGGITLKFSP